MKTTVLLAAILALSGTATAQITPAQDAQIKRVLREIVEMDDELKAIQANQQTLENNAAARRDEYRSLITRYPGISISPESSTSDMYRALHDYRMKRAATVKPLVDEQSRDANAKMCAALKNLKDDRDRLEASDDYKRTKLQDRIDLRKAFDDLIAETMTEGDPCTFSPE